MSFALPVAFTFANPEQGTLAENLTFIGLGFGWVMLVLVLMFLLTSLVGIYFKRDEKARAVERAEFAAASRTVSAPQGVDPALVVVIAAAVKTIVDEPHRVVSIRPAQGDWSREGRRSIFESHRISRHR